MSSQRCTNPGRLSAILLVLLAVAGCAGPGLMGGKQSTVQDEATTGSVYGDVPARAVPPQVNTAFERAAASLAAGDFVEAQLRFETFVLQYPEYPGAWVNLAIIYSANESDAAAQVAIEEALALNPNYPAALNQLGMLLRRNGKFPEAEAAYLKAVTVSPEYALAHYNLGVLNELYLQRLDVALQHFESYQALAGEDRQVAMWIADLTRRVAANQRTANVTD